MTDVALAVNEDYHKDMIDVLPERVIRFRLPDLTIVYCNAAWANGHSLDPVDVIGRTMGEMLSPAAMADLEVQLGRLSPDNPIAVDDRARPAPNAPGRWVEWVDQYLPSADGAEVLGVGRDVTARHIAEVMLADSEARFRDLADNSADIVWRSYSYPYPHFDYVSPSVEKILGYSPSFFLGDLSCLLGIIDGDEDKALITRAIEGEAMPDRHDFRCRRADGSIAIIEMRTTPIPGGLQGVNRDVTELRSLQENLVARALRDPLTGLANRDLLKELLEAALARTERDQLPVAVVFIDLDDFKSVNDTHGHDAGDAVLRETARRLVSIMRAADVVARVGGDEFVIVYELGDLNPEALIARINRTLCEPISISDTVAVYCPASMGHADTRTVGRNLAALLTAADTAMYDEKRSRNRYLG